MAPVTEIAILPLKAGISLDPNADTGTVFQEALTTLLDQPGLQRVYWGPEVENPSQLRLFVDWDSIDSHKQFMGAPQYQPFLKTLGQVLDGAPTLYHVSLAPHPPSAALGVNTPTTEVLTAHFASDVSSSTVSAFEDRLKKLVSVIEENAPAEAYRGSAGGWSVETDVPQSGDAAKKGKVYVAVIGWASVDAHHAFRETKEFKDNIHLLREAEGIQATELVHVETTENQAGGLGPEERGAIDASGGSGAGNVQEEVLNPQAAPKVAPKAHSDGTTTKNATQSQYKDPAASREK